MLSANQFHLQFATPISTSSVVGPDWPNYKYMLVIMTDDEGAQIRDTTNDDPEFDHDPIVDDTRSERSNGRLSTIAEGDEEQEFVITEITTEEDALAFMAKLDQYWDNEVIDEAPAENENPPPEGSTYWSEYCSYVIEPGCH